MNSDENGEKGRSDGAGFFNFFNCFGLSKRTLANEASYGKWILFWGICFLANDLVTEGEMIPGVMGLVPAILTVLVSVIACYKYYVFLVEADELTRKIQLDGISIGFGVTLMACVGFQTFEDHGLAQPDITDIVLLLIFAWVGGQFYGHWKYR